ncbi:hypothetical protein Q4E93_11140 [Flavitalea sp. BT771]|uniref:hypothetical protein n=1 Tax=Flavitalea sp. BT771 TaxID=3063329 RepID=UPI0026E42347|nr:hypothetical protein [Flavitalea sp. BT771]MDO6431147.1 hypothetical protein [Flavitalea sp. BT771]MDV6220054.1 hypothetical protein [Flavitalea sp. BT771]
MINEIEKETKSTENLEPVVGSTETLPSEQGGIAASTAAGASPKPAKRKRKSSAIAAAAMGRSAVGSVMPNASLDIEGRGGLLNLGSDGSYNE